jgi:hypothetical protein
MTKRARYTGSEAVKVAWPPGHVYPEQEWTVEPNHWLPEDAPAALRDELLGRDNWTEVEQQAAPASSSKTKNDEE